MLPHILSINYTTRTKGLKKFPPDIINPKGRKGGIYLDWDTDRPVKELKGFRKVCLKPRESKQVEFGLSANNRTFYNAFGVWKAGSGDFQLWVGTNSQEGLQGKFRLK